MTGTLITDENPYRGRVITYRNGVEWNRSISEWEAESAVEETGQYDGVTIEWLDGSRVEMVVGRYDSEAGRWEYVYEEVP